MNSYAKVVVYGSPITKSNFKLHNKNGRAILPYNTGQSHDRYAIYEQEIAFNARSQNPDIILTESLIAVLKVFYKSELRHPDTANITKSIFDGIEKSGLIINDSQIRRIYIEEHYDKENPRFELEFFGESQYEISCSIVKRDIESEKRIYSRKKSNSSNKTTNQTITTESEKNICNICKKSVDISDCRKADRGKTLICNSCFKKLF